MRIVDEKLLREFRSPGRCEHCKEFCRVREGHHLLGKGFGSGNRLDIRINLIALGSTQEFQCTCHREYHDGHLLRATFLALVAVRERILADDVESLIYTIRRLPKGTPVEHAMALIEERRRK